MKLELFFLGIIYKRVRTAQLGKYSLGFLDNVRHTVFSNVADLERADFCNTGSLKSNLSSWRWICSKKFDVILQCDTFDTFSVDFKKLIGVALAIWGKIEPELYFEDT